MELNIEVTSSKPDLLHVMGETTVQMTYSWSEAPKYRKGNLFLAHDKAILVDELNAMTWGRCRQFSVSPMTARCEPLGTHPLGEGFVLNPKVVAVGDVIVAFATNE